MIHKLWNYIVLLLILGPVIPVNSGGFQTTFGGVQTTRDSIYRPKKLRHIPNQQVRVEQKRGLLPRANQHRPFPTEFLFGGEVITDFSIHDLSNRVN